MGTSSSRHRRNNHTHQQQNRQNSNHHDHHHDHQNQLNPPLSSSSTITQTHQVPSFTSSNDTTTTSPTTSNNLVLTENRPIPSINNSLSNTVIPSPLPQAPQQPQNCYFAANAPYNSYNYHHHNLPPPPPSYNNHGWTPYNYHHRPGFMPPPPPPLVRQSNSNLVPVQQPRYVDHNQAKTVKNDVNVHKGTIKLVVDENNLDSYLVSFAFDALVDGSITIFYFAKEGDNCKFTPLYPEIYMPRRIPFKKGSGQKFSQPSGTGIDLGFFELDQLSNPSTNEDVFPLVIFADGSSPSLPTSTSTEPDQPLPTTSTHAQITQAVLEKNNEGHFQVKVVKQILWIDGVRYELREIYGIASADAAFDDSDPGKECVICMTEPKDTAVLPCRHMCLCSGCAKELSLQSDRCPICRQPIRELMEIKLILNKESQDR